MYSEANEFVEEIKKDSKVTIYLIVSLIISSIIGILLYTQTEFFLTNQYKPTEVNEVYEAISSPYKEVEQQIKINTFISNAIDTLKKGQNSLRSDSPTIQDILNITNLSYTGLIPNASITPFRITTQKHPISDRENIYYYGLYVTNIDFSKIASGEIINIFSSEFKPLGRFNNEEEYNNAIKNPSTSDSISNKLTNDKKDELVKTLSKNIDESISLYETKKSFYAEIINKKNAYIKDQLKKLTNTQTSYLMAIGSKFTIMAILFLLEVLAIKILISELKFSNEMKKTHLHMIYFDSSKKDSSEYIKVVNHINNNIQKDDDSTINRCLIIMKELLSSNRGN